MPKKLQETRFKMLIAALWEMEKPGNKVAVHHQKGLWYILTKDSHAAVQINELGTHNNSMNHKNIMMSILG